MDVSFLMQFEKKIYSNIEDKKQIIMEFQLQLAPEYCKKYIRKMKDVSNTFFNLNLTKF
jgi:hypothetical protein